MTCLAVSLVVPIYNEAASLPALQDSILSAAATSFGNVRLEEIIYVDDGSDDATATVLRGLASASRIVRVLHFTVHCGKSAALGLGFSAAVAPIVVIMDADMQYDPRDIPALVWEVRNTGGMAIGWREHRKDSWARRVQSRLFNSVLNRFLDRPLRDANSGLKAMPSAMARSLPSCHEWHRFHALIAERSGLAVREVAVAHASRKWSKSRYGLARAMRWPLDLRRVLVYLRCNAGSRKSEEARRHGEPADVVDVR